MSTSILIDTFDAIIGELPRLATMAMQEERAAVVAWLRGQQEASEWALTAAGYEHAADTIERGEHLNGVTND